MYNDKLGRFAKKRIEKMEHLSMPMGLTYKHFYSCIEFRSLVI